MTTSLLVERPVAALDASRQPSPKSTPLRLGNLTIDFDAFEARVDDRPLSFTSQEMALLILLARHAGQLVPHSQISNVLWGRGRPGCSHLGVIVSRLRAKLAEAEPYRIETIRQRGYRLCAPA